MKITSFIISFISIAYVHANIPIVINTWNFMSATKKAWELLKDGKSARDAITHGCAVCEVEQCDGTVGYGGSPDENGETTLDAMIFDGTAMDMGAVGGLRRIKNAIAVAREVLEHTEQSFLVGDLATAFAKSLNYEETSLSTNHSLSIWQQWKNADNCQPNFWKDVVPDPKKYCGPYESIDSNELAKENEYDNHFNSLNHDTIGMIIIDTEANVVVGTSTNGATHKIPGRVGDSPIPGAGAYADSEVGGAVATGDGDVMMRFLPSFLAVEEMRRGASPSRAAREAILRIVKKYPNFFGGVIAVTKKGVYGAACNGMDKFPFSLGDKENDNIKIKYVCCITGKIY